MTDVMDIAPLIYWIAGLSTLANFANMAWSIFSGPTRKLTERLAKTEAQLQEVERRAERHSNQIAHVTQTLASMPGHQALHQLEITLTRMDGEIGKLAAVMDGNSQIMKRLEMVVTRHEDHLLDGGKR